VERKAKRGRSADLGYVMACAFSEQLESGMYDLHQLADLAESWGMKVGEPTVHKSMFKFPLSSKYRWKMGNIFDKQEMNFNFRKLFNINYNLIVSQRDILSNTDLSSDVVFVHWTNAPRYSHAECWKVAMSTVKDCTRSINGVWPHDRYNLSVICLQKQKKVDFRNLIYNHPVLSKVRLQNKRTGSKFSVVFTSWSGIRSKRGPFFYFDPNFHQHHYGHPHSIAHSNEVLAAAKELGKVAELRSPSLGVHVRLERLIRRKYFISRCLTDMLEAIDSLRAQGLWEVGVAFTDYRSVGSQTCGRIHCAGIAQHLEIDKKLEAHGVRVNPSMPGNQESSLQQESGFVSNVEQEVLSRADVLVMVGFGSFQTGILDRYRKYHNSSLLDFLGTDSGKNPKIIRICQDRSWRSPKGIIWGPNAPWGHRTNWGSPSKPTTRVHFNLSIYTPW